MCLPFRQIPGQMQVSAAHLRHPRDASGGSLAYPLVSKVMPANAAVEGA